MIATLTGIVTGVSGENCIIEVGGVGYLVFMPLPALETLSRVDGPVKVYTHFHLREDGATLYGFLSSADQNIFEKIIGVSGIGPKTALAILGNLPGDRFREAIQNEDHRTLTAVPGIGLKTAQRLTLELKGKLGKSVGSGDASLKVAGSSYSISGDAVDALVSLGYPGRDAVSTVETLLAENKGLTSPELVRLALKNLGRK
ncbi:MAG TPA: Holliday junction branch migration protein RuvA [Firmicutes bacterium]|jgi:holliday junction DNA helicase RuvA|nr:Holliday junction branch migration protein RuvA [Bacillota bacterium]